jgi:hypothetical protein
MFRYWTRRPHLTKISVVIVIANEIFYCNKIFIVVESNQKKIDRANLPQSPKRIFPRSIHREILAVRPLYKSGTKPAYAGHAGGVWESLTAFP